MATITQVREAMQMVLGPIADQLGWKTHFSQRRSKLSGSSFVRALVFGGMGTAELSYTQLSASALDAGVSISPQGLEQRFSPASAQLCQRVLAASVQAVVQARPCAVGILARFAGVYLRDSSVVSLPDELAGLWTGVGHQAGQTAAVKLQVRLEYGSGQLAGPILQAGREHDRHSPFQGEALPAGGVRLGDLGYFSLAQFARDQSQGVYTFSRYKIGTNLYTQDGQAIDLLPWLQSQTCPQFERRICLGRQVRFACRLLVERVPQAVAEQRRRKLKEYARKKQVAVQTDTLALAEWTLIITDIPPELLSIPEALILLSVRWQIELLFKLWKSLLQIDACRSHKPWRILTELYAKLIGAVILHWTFLVELWRYPHRSLWKAALMVGRFATALAIAFPNPQQMDRLLEQIQIRFRLICHLNPRQAHPNTSQRLLPLKSFNT